MLASPEILVFPLATSDITQKFSTCSTGRNAA